jgi:hypothetical protein
LRYERLSSAITDQLTLDGIKELIKRVKHNRPRFTRSKSSKAASVGGLFHCRFLQGSARHVVGFPLLQHAPSIITEGFEHAWEISELAFMSWHQPKGFWIATG